MVTEIDDGPADSVNQPSVATVSSGMGDREPVSASEVPVAADQPVDDILAALMARIAPVTEAPTYRKVMVYGPPGTGKTTLAATAPKPLLVDIERGTMSLLNDKTLLGVDVLEFKSVKQLELLIQKLAEGAFGNKYETLIIDSFSELQKRDLDDTLQAASRIDASRNKFLPTGPDYNMNTEHMRQIASGLRDLPMNVVVTSHVKEEKDDSTGRLLVRPNLTPKLSGTMTGIFDIVGYLTITGSGDSAVRSLQVHPTDKITAKTRVGGLPPVIENPTFNSIFATATN